jgi:hypothetical protein
MIYTELGSGAESLKYECPDCVGISVAALHLIDFYSEVGFLLFNKVIKPIRDGCRLDQENRHQEGQGSCEELGKG